MLKKAGTRIVDHLHYPHAKWRSAALLALPHLFNAQLFARCFMLCIYS